MDQRNSNFEAIDALNFEYKLLISIIDGSRAGTWVWNVQTGETRFNARWAEIVGYDLAELQPISIDTWIALTHPDDLKKSNDALERHFDGLSEFYECDARMKHKSGHWIWIQDRGKLISRSEDGLPLWMAGSHIEVTKDKAIQAIRDEALEQLQAIARNISGVLYQYVQRPDGSSYYAYVSEQLADIYGCDANSAKSDSKDVWSTIYAGDLAAITAAVRRSAENLSVFHQKFRIQHPRKGLRWIESKSTPTVAPSGETIWHGYSQDITDQRSSEENLRVAANVFTYSPEAILIADDALKIISSNDASHKITGYMSNELKGKRLGAWTIDPFENFISAENFEQLKKSGHWHGELTCRHKSGAAYVALASINAVKNNQDEVTHYVAILTDISSIKQKEEELTRYANYDVLTGLPNRRLFQDRLIQAFRRAYRTNGELAVAVLDIDGFKQINDKYGHAAGDKLLREVGQRLINVLRSDDTVARLGGDEFAFVICDIENTKIFERILQALSEPISILESASVRVSASLGFTYLKSRLLDADKLLGEADEAMYKAKKSGKNRCILYQ
jgi:diguanylate cyclase (GGDEF)-like protein/PAS domain S-box-containing protein